MKPENANADQMQVFVTINCVRTKINVGVNVKNWLINEYMMNYLAQSNIQTTKIVNLERK